MPRIDVARIRKAHRMSQAQLAEKLSINQSFLSAIENGRSALPPDKEERIKTIFPDWQDAIAEDHEVPAHVHANATGGDAQLFNHMLSHLHQQAHSLEDGAHHREHHERLEALEDRLSAVLDRLANLLDRNEALAKRNEELLEEVAHLRAQLAGKG